MSKEKIRTQFSKTGDMRYISHLDLVRLFQRASRRADMPVTLTKGFSPRLKISVARALKLGVESTGEEAFFYMDRAIDPQIFIDSFNRALPEGVRMIKAEGEIINA
jgi:radical SAM-linked protein